jgi:hypothetical protein
MTVNPDNVDLTNIEAVTDIEPEPTLIVGHNEHYFGPLGEEGKRLLAELLDATADGEPVEQSDTPIGTRVFDRLGLDYTHAEWNGYELFWAKASTEEVVDALRSWHEAYIMS